MTTEEFENGSSRETIKEKLRRNFDGKIVRKDLTKKIKEGANVPVYVLEFLLGQYCSSDDEEIIERGVQNVKRILADNFVRPDEAQKILSMLRKNGSHTIIDMVTVHLDMKRDCFFAEFSNLGVGNVPISDDYPEKYDRLLCGGIWCIIQLDYESEGDKNFGIIDPDGFELKSKQKSRKTYRPSVSVEEVGFRGIYQHFWAIPLKEAWRSVVKDFPGAKQANYLLTYGYVDHEAGLTLEVLACAVGEKTRARFFDGNSSIRFFIRIGAVKDIDIAYCNDDNGELYEQYADMAQCTVG